MIAWTMETYDMWRLPATLCCVAGLVVASCADDHDHAAPHSHGDHDHAASHAHGDHDHDTAHVHGDADHGPPVGPEDPPDPHAAEMISTTIAPEDFGGRAVSIQYGGQIHPGGEVHVEGEITSGPVTDVLRFWIGVESGQHSVKARSDVHDGYFHAHVEVPDPMPMDAALWIEATDDSGQRQRVHIRLL